MKTLITVSILVWLATIARAGLLTDLTFNGTSDTLRDEGVGLFHDNDASGTMSSGDVLQGVAQIAEIVNDLASGIPQNSLYGIYSLQVSSVAGTKVNYGPATGVHSISSIMSSVGMSTAGMTPFSGTIADATFVFAEKSVSAPLASMDAPGGSLVSGGAVGTVISGPGGWTPSLITGLTGDDFYSVLLGDLSYTGLATLAALDPDTIYSQYRTAQSILFHGFAPAASFGVLPVDADYTAGTDNRDGHLISSGNNFFSEPSDIAAAGGWHSSADGNFRMLAHMPEPNSLMVIGVAGLLSVFRRRRID